MESTYKYTLASHEQAGIWWRTSVTDCRPVLVFSAGLDNEDLREIQATAKNCRWIDEKNFLVGVTGAVGPRWFGAEEVLGCLWFNTFGPLDRRGSYPDHVYHSNFTLLNHEGVKTTTGHELRSRCMHPNRLTGDCGPGCNKEDIVEAGLEPCPFVCTAYGGYSGNPALEDFLEELKRNTPRLGKFEFVHPWWTRPGGSPFTPNIRSYQLHEFDREEEIRKSIDAGVATRRALKEKKERTCSQCFYRAACAAHYDSKTRYTRIHHILQCRDFTAEEDVKKPLPEFRKIDRKSLGLLMRAVGDTLPWRVKGCEVFLRIVETHGELKAVLVRAHGWSKEPVKGFKRLKDAVDYLHVWGKEYGGFDKNWPRVRITDKSLMLLWDALHVCTYAQRSSWGRSNEYNHRYAAIRSRGQVEVVYSDTAGEEARWYQDTLAEQDDAYAIHGATWRWA